MKDAANALGALGLMAAIFLIYDWLSQRIAERVVPPGGALMALDADGLRELNELYAVPAICGDKNFAKDSDPKIYIARCVKAVRLTPGMVKEGMILLSSGTRGRSLGTRHMLQEEPKARGAAPPKLPLEVEKVRVTDGSNRGLVGWVVKGYLSLSRTIEPWP